MAGVFAGPDAVAAGVAGVAAVVVAAEHGVLYFVVADPFARRFF